jgi:hypothetical protein
MREILTQRRFSEEEIALLEARDDYEIVQQQVERLGINTLLDRLEIRSEETIHSLEERWEQLKQDIAQIEADGLQVQNETGETLDTLRERLQSEAIARTEETIRSRVGWIPVF